MSNTCKCLQICRPSLWETINGSQYPAPTHLDGCALQVRERFVRIGLDETFCTVEPRVAEEMLSSSEEYTATDVMLTRDQFNALEEFAGF